MAQKWYTWTNYWEIFVLYIIFDRYPSSNEADVQQSSTASSTETVKRLRRQSCSNSLVFELVPHTNITTTQDKFLSNEKNQVDLIKWLSEALKYEGLVIRQTEEDADALIVNTTIEIAKKIRLPKKQHDQGITSILF